MQLTAEHLGIPGRTRLVLLHGFSQTARSWTRVAAALAPQHDVVLVDAPGHGGSTSIEAGLADGARLLGEVGGAAIYVGYSMGARFCLRLALDRPDLVQGLVLVGATAGLDDAGERAARRRADADLAASIERDGIDSFVERWLAQPMFAALPRDERDRADRRRNTEAGLASSLRLAGTAELEPLWNELARLEMAVLVIVGELDTKFRPLGKRIVAAIGSNASLAIVPGAHHAAHLEAPDTFVGVLRPWLATVTAGREG